MWKHLLQSLMIMAVGLVLCGFGSHLAPPDASYTMAVFYAIIYVSGIIWFASSRLSSSFLKNKDK